MTTRHQLRIPVPSPTGEPWHIAGWLTAPDVPARDEIQILVHGASYDHRYWDWPLEPATYSYVHHATTAGHATLAIDRIGSGVSTRPPGRTNTIKAQAQALSGLIAAARDGQLGRKLRRIVLVGHSLGSILAGAEAAWYRDVEAVVMTGHLGIDSGALDNDPRAAAGFLPVAEDPTVAHLTGIVDDGYLTVRSELRESMFYTRHGVDPQILTLDEQIKGVLTLGEISDMGSAADATGGITAPTLVVLGEHDGLEFDASFENSTYDAIRRVGPKSPKHYDFAVVPGSGHNLNLHHSAPSTFETIREWLDGLSG